MGAFTWLTLTLVAGSHAYLAGLSPSGPRPSATLMRAPRLVSPAVRARSVVMTEASEAETVEDDGPTSPLGKFRAWISKWNKFDKDKIKTLGVDAFFTYGVVSNMNAGLTVALAWGTFSKASGLSPLAPGQLKGFFATYTALYLSLGSILRPFRMAAAVTLTPVYGNAVSSIRDRLPYRDSRPKLNRTLALVLISLLLNVVGTLTLMGGGAYLAGLVTGVPAFPPGTRPWRPLAVS